MVEKEGGTALGRGRGSGRSRNSKVVSAPEPWKLSGSDITCKYPRSFELGPNSPHHGSPESPLYVSPTSPWLT